MLRKLVIVALAMLPSVLLAGQPVQDIETQPVGVKVDGSAFSSDEVKGAIVQACHGRGWTPRLEANDTVIASILVRGRHFAEVEIPFDAKAFSIRYRSSRDLDYNAKRRTIHRNYNKWVVLLSRDIGSQLTKLTSGIPPAR